MAEAKKTKEIFVTTENKVGMLKEISSIISKTGVNITAVCAYASGDKANFMIVTDNNQRAVASLKEKGYRVEEKEALEVRLKNDVGALEEISAKIADAHIDINHIYGTTDRRNDAATLVLSSNNDDKILEILK